MAAQVRRVSLIMASHDQPESRAAAGASSPAVTRPRAALQHARALLAAGAIVLRARAAPRRALLRQLQHTTSDGGDAIRFSRAELPSSGEVTIRADLEVIHELEEMVRARFVRHAILAERSRLARRSSTECALDFKQLDGLHLPELASGLLADGTLAALRSLSLCGNLLGASDVALLLSTFACRPDAAPALRTLRLAHNVHLGTEGVRHLADALAAPDCRLRELDLRGCRLGPEAGFSLARALGRGRSLRQLTLADNALDDAAVLALLDARTAMGSHGTRLHIAVEGNPISDATSQLVMFGHVAADGGGEDSSRQLRRPRFSHTSTAARSSGGSAQWTRRPSLPSARPESRSSSTADRASGSVNYNYKNTRAKALPASL
jgi:hypothetical protein